MGDKGKKSGWDRPGTGWGRSDSGSGRTPPTNNDGCQWLVVAAVLSITWLADVFNWIGDKAFG